MSYIDHAPFNTVPAVVEEHGRSIKQAVREKKDGLASLPGLDFSLVHHQVMDHAYTALSRALSTGDDDYWLSASAAHRSAAPPLT